jgi:hypothetical protein
VYEILLHKAGERTLKRLSQQEFTRLIAAIKALGIIQGEADAEN